MKQYLKTLFYLASAIAISSVANVATAGSYDDFFSAVQNDRGGEIGGLLKRGFDPNTVDAKGQPGLLLAVREQSHQATRVLLEQPGIQIDALNPAGESALMIAAIRGNIADARLLLERGAKVNQPGWAALHYAASGPEPQLVRLLLDRGAEIDAGSPNGTTPLMMAAQYGSEDSIKLLLDRGADAKRRNQLGLDAVDFARLAKRDSLAARLEPLRR